MLLADATRGKRTRLRGMFLLLVFIIVFCGGLAANALAATTSPAITSLSPTAGPVAGGNTVTINGSSLTGATGVTFGATAATNLDVVSSSKITVTAPAGTGIVDVRVSTPKGTSAIGSADKYAYTPAPTISGISPQTGPTTGGATVVITGANLSGTTAVKFGTAAAKSFTINSATQITSVGPAGSGTVDASVTTPGGGSASTSADKFTYKVNIAGGNRCDDCQPGVRRRTSHLSVSHR